MPTMDSCPQLSPIPTARFQLDGEIGRRLAAVTEQWILPAPYANPGMLEMFRSRDRRPYQDQVEWAGEFAGKYLTHAVQIYRLTREAKLGKHIRWFVGELIALQDADGYLGPWPSSTKLLTNWDAWGHYHAMVGMLLWHEESGDRKARDCVCRMADLFCRRFLPSAGGRERLHSAGSHEMNQAPIHALGMLYRLTGVKRYLEMALQIEKEFAIPPAGDYTRTALDGLEFFETPKPRWESLHPIMGLVELYYATGRQEFRTAFERLWWSMLKGDRHNNGGFTSGEKATGNPYDAGAIETCCTVAWMAMSVEMLKLTGNPLVADEIELSLLNAGLGMMSPSGRWVTYNTPMDGQRRASAHDIVFQARAGTPELNCCSVNGPRVLGMISDWALMRRGRGLVLNYYGPGAITAALPSGNRVRLAQETDYPRSADVRLGVKPSRAERFVLALRIPYWSGKTAVSVNGKPVKTVKAGAYLELDRTWKAGDRVAIKVDFPPRFWTSHAVGGEEKREFVVSSSIYRGPILLAYDPRHNAAAPDEFPVLDARRLKLKKVQERTWLKPWMLLEAAARDGKRLRLCDFGSAGAAGDTYRSWLPVSFPSRPDNAFSRENPLRSIRVGTR